MQVFVAVTIAILVAMAHPAKAIDDRETAIRSVIDLQVQAFGRDDAEAAYAVASPMIQAQFGNADTFLAMVRRSYPQVYRPRQFRFGKLVDVQGKLLQHVLVQGPDDAIVTAVYDMVSIDGAWRINGCYLLRGGDEA